MLAGHNKITEILEEEKANYYGGHQCQVDIWLSESIVGDIERISLQLMLSVHRWVWVCKEGDCV